MNRPYSYGERQYGDAAKQTSSNAPQSSASRSSRRQQRVYPPGFWEQVFWEVEVTGTVEAVRKKHNIPKQTFYDHRRRHRQEKEAAAAIAAARGEAFAEAGLIHAQVAQQQQNGMGPHMLPNGMFIYQGQPPMMMQQQPVPFQQQAHAQFQMQPQQYMQQQQQQQQLMQQQQQQQQMMMMNAGMPVPQPSHASAGATLVRPPSKGEMRKPSSLEALPSIDDLVRSGSGSSTGSAAKRTWSGESSVSVTELPGSPSLKRRNTDSLYLPTINELVTDDSSDVAHYASKVPLSARQLSTTAPITDGLERARSCDENLEIATQLLALRGIDDSENA